MDTDGHGWGRMGTDGDSGSAGMIHREGTQRTQRGTRVLWGLAFSSSDECAMTGCARGSVRCIG